MGALSVDPRAPGSISGYSFVFLSVYFRPRTRPLTPDPSLFPQRAVTADPDLSIPRVGVRA